MRTAVFSTIVVAATLFSSFADADEESFLSRRLTATPGVEASLAVGYGRPYGRVESGRSIGDIAFHGIANDVEIGYRIAPEIGVALSLEYDDFSPGGGNVHASRSFVGGASATLHFRPREALDPWLGAGAGYRVFWDARDAPDANVAYEGFRLARLLIGLDLRSDSSLAVAPVIGADVTLFFWQRPDLGPTSAIGDPRVSTFFFGGIQGRLDFGGGPSGAEVARAR